MSKKIKGHLSSTDVILKDIILQIPFPKIKSTQNVFHDLMSCIIEQQIHYRSTKKVFQKRMEAAGMEELTIDTFSSFEEEGFKNLKLSARKFETINSILEFFQNNKIDWKKQSDEEVRKLLGQIKGVGVWTIDMILIYTLERENIFPADDYHIKQMMTQQYDIDTSSRVKAQMKAIAETWSPYKSIATKYLLAWKTFQKELKTTI